MGFGMGGRERGTRMGISRLGVDIWVMGRIQRISRVVMVGMVGTVVGMVGTVGTGVGAEVGEDIESALL